MNSDALKRDIIDEITKYLGTDNIIVLHGARQVGKSHILFYLKKQLEDNNQRTYFFDLEDSRFAEVLDAGLDSMLNFLKNESYDLEEIQKNSQKLYVFIDEVQYLKDPSPLLKLLIDHHKYIQLIVSGSSSFNIKSKFSDSLVGRTVDFEIFNLSFSEFLRFKKENINISHKLDKFHLEKVLGLYEEYAIYGGYPKIILENSIEKKEKYLQQIIDTYIKKDIRDLANIKNIDKFNGLLKILASQSGNMLNVAELAKACRIAQQTVETYLFILENTYIIKLIRPFSSNAKVEIVKTPKIFFYDTGILQMLWLRNLEKTFVGNVFETSIFSELVKKYGAQNINYWRNKNQNEIDFILSRKDGLLPIEVKKNFGNFRKASITFFLDKYKAKDYKVASILGEKKDEHFIYPWEL
ncbi:MAG: ATP-binding protein [bacterium]|nr:ATP-binding protein [bacterium]